MQADRFLGAATLAVAAVLATVGVGMAFAYDESPRPLPALAQPASPAITAQAPAAPVGDSGTTTPDPFRPADSWIATNAAATGIPPRALQAYARAHLRMADEQPDCQVGWTTIAAIGGVESAHGSAGGATLGDDGWPRPAIVGPALDGGAFGAIHDSDGGVLDGDTTWDHAVGPLQFIPSTWERWGADGNGDGTADPNQIDDAALAATRYLCHSGDLSSASHWRAAIFSFNHSDVYVDDIAALANQYAANIA